MDQRLAYIDYACIERDERGCELQIEGHLARSNLRYELECGSMPGSFRVLEIDSGTCAGIGIAPHRQFFRIDPDLPQVELETADGFRTLKIPQP